MGHVLSAAPVRLPLGTREDTTERRLVQLRRARNDPAGQPHLAEWRRAILRQWPDPDAVRRQLACRIPQLPRVIGERIRLFLPPCVMYVDPTVRRLRWPAQAQSLFVLCHDPVPAASLRGDQASLLAWLAEHATTRLRSLRLHFEHGRWFAPLVQHWIDRPRPAEACTTLDITVTQTMTWDDLRRFLQCFPYLETLRCRGELPPGDGDGVSPPPLWLPRLRCVYLSAGPRSAPVVRELLRAAASLTRAELMWDDPPPPRQGSPDATLPDVLAAVAVNTLSVALHRMGWALAAPSNFDNLCRLWSDHRGAELARVGVLRLHANVYNTDDRNRLVTVFRNHGHAGDALWIGSRHRFRLDDDGSMPSDDVRGTFLRPPDP